MGQRRKPKKDALSSWQEKNPLRLWRLKQQPEGWNRSLLARQLDSSHTSVEAWEKGTRLPRVDAFAKIEKLTEITSQQWMDWFNSKTDAK